MGNPFKEQFLKKGLVTKKQVNKVKHDQRVSSPKKRNKKKEEVNDLQAKIQQARLEQVAQDRELNRQRNEVAKEKEIEGQISQIIAQNRVETKGDVSFHFTDGSKIKKLYLKKEIADALSKGKMAIIKQEDKYAVVPTKAACQIRDRKAESLLLLNSSTKQEMDKDDPYAEFPIPDDYDW